MTQFKNYLQLNYSKTTYNLYLSYINNYFKDYSEITSDNIVSYLLKHNFSNSKFNMFLKSIKTYINYNKIEVSLPKFKQEVIQPKEVFSIDYAEQNLIPLIDKLSLNPKRDKLIIYLMIYTGMRRQDIVNLKVEDFDLVKGQVKVFQQKTQRYRVCFYPEKVKDYLSDYLKDKQGKLFDISGNGLYQIFRRLKPNFKQYNIYPHLMRHIFSTELYQRSGDINLLKEQRGDTNIKTTLRYTQNSVEYNQNKYNEIFKEAQRG